MIEKLVVLNRQEQFLEGFGKLQVLRIDSTTLAELYNIEGIKLKNPVYTNGEGRLDQDVFVDSGVYLVKVFRYIGEITPEADSEDASWEFVREFYKGLEEIVAIESHSVETIDSLRQVNPAEKIVKVTGYWTENDCESRTYVWDEDCAQDDDCGYVIKSSVQENGAWVLLFSGDYLPSSYYGVYEDHEENMSYLLGYPEQVGSFFEETARGVYFVPGIYSESTVALVTNKAIKVTGESQFTRSRFEAPSVEVIGSSDYGICDFKVSGGVVRSSWFKTVAGFWNSGADEFIIDKVNELQVTTHSVIAIENKIIKNESAGTIDANNVRFVNCSIIGTKLFNTSDVIEFRSMEITDNWFSGALMDMNKLRIGPGLLNVLKVCNFRNTTNFLNCSEQNVLVTETNTSIDFEGATIATATIHKFKNVKNLRVTGTLNVGLDVTFDHCNINNLSLGDNCFYLTLKNSDVHIGSQNRLIRLEAEKSTINGTVDWDGTVAVIAKESYWSLPIKSNTITQDPAKSFYDCEIGNCNLWTSNLSISKSRLNQTKIKIYFYEVESNKYKWTFNLSYSVFNSNTPIEFTYVNDDYRYKYGISCEIGIFDNTFSGESIKMAYKTPDLQHRVLEYADSLSFVYKNNIGSCPLEKLDTKIFEDNLVNVAGYANKVTPSTYRVFNLTHRNEINQGELMNNCTYFIARPGNAVEYRRDSTGVSNEVKLVHRSAFDDSVNDQFEVYLTVTEQHEDSWIICL